MMSPSAEAVSEEISIIIDFTISLLTIVLLIVRLVMSSFQFFNFDLFLPEFLTCFELNPKISQFQNFSIGFRGVHGVNP